MSSLRDPFDVVHKKDIKNKQGEVVAKVDYVGWSQVADRLDDAAPGWAFEIRQLGDDWCWGRLTLDGRTFENVGYAENAEAAWKKEALKDAVSDALKRCAAMAGVARYLYDKDAPTQPVRPAQRTDGVRLNARQALELKVGEHMEGSRPAAVAARSSTEVPEPPLDWDVLSDKKPVPFAAAQAAKIEEDGSWTFAQLADRAKSLSVPTKVLSDTSKRLYGPNAWKLTELTGEQRYTIAVEVGLL